MGRGKAAVTVGCQKTDQTMLVAEFVRAQPDQVQVIGLRRLSSALLQPPLVPLRDRRLCALRVVGEQGFPDDTDDE